MFEKKAAELCLVSYIDLAETTGVSTQDFFGEHTTLSRLSTVGWVMEQDVQGIHCIKVCYIHDDDGEENSSGIVIPISCVLKCEILEGSGKDLLSISESN
jgi:hypothetical protein